MAEEPYIVLARKHRPRQFNQVVGQEHIARTLSNAISHNRIPHAFLFTGPRGIGKTSMARILARAVNCQQGPTPTPCDHCPSCLEIAQGTSVDVIEIDAASNRGIDEIRDLREAVRYPPSRERYKVYIIDEVHMLTTPAFNALLKTLEEPPSQVLFVFATTEPHKIPETIRSRCQRHDFRRIPHHLVAEHLGKIAAEEGVSIEPQALQIIARQSEGCMRDAQSLLDQLISFSSENIDGPLASRVLGVIGRDALLRLSRAVIERDVDTVLSVVDEAYRVGVNLVQMTSDLLEHLRDLAVCSVSRDKACFSHLSDVEQQEIASLAAITDITTVHRLFTILLEAAADMSRSAYPKLLLEMALLRMSAIEPLQPVAALVQRIEQLIGTDPGDLGSSTPPAPPGQPGGATPTARQAPPQTSRQGLATTEISRPPAAVQVPAAKPAPTTSEQNHALPSPGPTLDDSGQIDRWRQLVSAVSEQNKTVGGLLKLAELTSAQGGDFVVQLPGATYDILTEPVKLALINQVAETLYGHGAKVNPMLRSETTAPQASLVYSVEKEERQLRDAELKRRAQVILEHPATSVLQETFEPAEVRIKPRPVDEETQLESDS